MSTATKALKQQARVQKRLQRNEERRDRAFERQLQRKLWLAKLNAMDDIWDAVYDAVKRLDSDEKTGWLQKGQLKKVCRHIGAHPDAFCYVFHRHVLLALVVIPGARAHSDDGSYERMYIGEDRSVYRSDGAMIYRADLVKRKTPGDIRALIPKIQQIS